MKLFGVDIATWYVLVVGSTLFCLFLLLVSMVVNEFRNWRSRGSKNDTNKDKS
jgi:hypothetical protein